MCPPAEETGWRRSFDFYGATREPRAKRLITTIVQRERGRYRGSWVQEVLDADGRMRRFLVTQSRQSTSSGEASRLLLAWCAGEESALGKLMPLVYKELRSLARRQMRRERAGHSLQATDLVNEAYVRLVDQRQAKWRHRSQFLAVAATVMRRILIDHARGHRYQKRGGNAVRIDIDDIAIVSPARSDELVALDDALHRLEQHDNRKSSVVELRYFGGLTVDEIAEVLGVSPITVKRDWSMAKAWLHRQMNQPRT